MGDHKRALLHGFACAVLLAHSAPAQESAAPAPASKPASRSVVEAEPLGLELSDAISAVRTADLARLESFKKIAALAWSIREQYPDLTPIELRVGAARNKEKRLAMQQLLGALFKQIEPSVIAELGASERPHVDAALALLEAFGRHARPAMPVLARMIMTVDESLAHNFSLAAEKIGGLEKDFVPALAVGLGSCDLAVRKRAIIAMHVIGQGWSSTSLGSAVNALAKALGDPDEDIRSLAAGVLQELGRAAAPAQEALRKAALAPKTFVGRQAALALYAIDPHDPAAIPGLMAMLDVTSGGDVEEAANALRKMGPAAAAALPKLVSRVRTEQRVPVLRAIAAIDADGSFAVPALVDAAPGTSFANGAVERLVGLAGRSPAALAWLKGALKGVPNGDAIVERYRRTPSDPDALFHVFAALFEAAPSAASFHQALRHMGFDCGRGVPLLVKGLSSPNREACFSAVYAVPILGTEAAPALPRLRSLLRDSQPEMRFAVLRALPKIDPSGATVLDDLMSLFDDESLNVRGEAIKLVGAFGREASRAAPTLARHRDVEEEYERSIARVALARVGGDNREVVAELVSELLQTDRFWVFARDLAEVEPPPLPAVEVLLAMVEREGATAEAAHALLLLARHEEHASPALPRMIAALESPEINVRTAAVTAIAAIGPAARDAVPALVVALDAASANQGTDHRYADLLDAIVRALGAIGPDAKAAIPHIVMACEVPGSRYGMAHGAESALDRIEPPQRPRLAIKVDPALRVCAGRWHAEASSTGEDWVSIARTRVVREPDGTRAVWIAQGEPDAGYEAVALYLRLGAGSLEVTGKHRAWGMDYPGGEAPFGRGTITFRSLDFGTGARVEGFLEFEHIHGRGTQVAFVCEDPFAEPK